MAEDSQAEVSQARGSLADQGEIVGKPTMLAKFDGMLSAEQILDSLKQIGYPLDDVSVLFRIEGSDQVIDLTTGHVASGQALTDEEVNAHKAQKGQTLVLLHPTSEQAPAVRKALAEVGHPDVHPDIEYAGETRAHGRLGGVDRHDEHTS